jgi:branched chain amino acid efflux pump
VPSTWYLVAVLAIVFTITVALRATPFAALRTLHNSTIVQELSASMPAGILAILAVTSLHSTTAAEPRAILHALIAVAATVGVHLSCGRRTILSVGIGTAVYVARANTV